MNFEEIWLKGRLDKTYIDQDLLGNIHILSKEECVKTAGEEIQMAIKKILDQEVTIETAPCTGHCICLGVDEQLKAEGYKIVEVEGDICITGGCERGVLYGAFHFIRLISTGKSIRGINIEESPSNHLRMLNHWDNMDGSIERGYSGKSFFYVDNQIVVDSRTHHYARLIASAGINGVVINNVNVKKEATNLITQKHFGKLSEMALIYRKYGIKLYLSLNFASPIELGGLETADPLDEGVKSWWKDKMKEVFANIPNLGGFLIKADSEGRPGPFTYGRNHADGANTLAEAVEPYNGLIIWRCFVYNCQQDWRDRKTDRARAGYDHFKPLDGLFRENVILQIKNGPMDFQVREPISPLLGGLSKTNQILEVQIAQEYTGQQRHVCYLIPMFKEVLAFKTYCKEDLDTVGDIVSGRTFNQTNCGIAAVTNTGNDENWTGHDLAAANLYGFARLSYNTDLSAREIAEEWAQLTFGQSEKVTNTIVDQILMPSWPAYEKYTTPLGIGWMVTPEYHYGPSVDGYEYSRWGTYHRADHLGLGVDRTLEGTGYTSQYHSQNANQYENVETCPEELLLFFHHLPYGYELKTGKTILQHIYDTHFEGVEDVEQMKKAWESLSDEIEPKVFERAMGRFEHQLEHSKEWRDQINSYFYRKSGIADEKGRQIY